MQFYPVTKEDTALIEAAVKTLSSVYDPQNPYHIVGAALRTKNGKVFTGVNCDGIHGSCAEFIAVGKAISAGERVFDAITAVHLQAKNYLVPPCGNCRQMLFEYCPDIHVILNDEQGNIVKTGIRELLPLAYEEIK